jgi:hypothetical protein
MTITDLYIQLFGKGAIKDGDVISMAEHGRVGGTNLGQGFKFSKEADMADKIQTSGTDTYVAFSIPGTAQATALWQALKIDTSGTVTWADGNSNFDNVATDLTILAYS